MRGATLAAAAAAATADVDADVGGAVDGDGGAGAAGASAEVEPAEPEKRDPAEDTSHLFFDDLQEFVNEAAPRERNIQCEIVRDKKGGIGFGRYPTYVVLLYD
jgi:hypothetical protein